MANANSPWNSTQREDWYWLSCAVLGRFSPVWPFCDPMNCSLPGSSVHGISQVIILKQVTISFSRESSRPTDWTRISCVSYIAGRLFTCWAIREAWYWLIIFFVLLSLIHVSSHFLAPHTFIGFLYMSAQTPLSFLNFLLFWQYHTGLWDLSFLTRDWTQATVVKSRVLTSRPPGNQGIFFSITVAV